MKSTQLNDDVEDLLEDAFLEFGRRFASERSAYSSSQQRKDVLEGMLVPIIHGSLRALPAEVLTDRDFWRYLATVEMLAFACWRDTKSGIPQDTSFGCSASALHADTVPLRMFNRGEISVRGSADRADEYRVARIPGADLWKSDILRRLNRYAPNAASSLATQVKDDGIPSAQLRAMVKQIKRARANVLLEVLDPTDAEIFVRRENTIARGATTD